ncbi:GlxA family transcriptional regulator [Pseudoduganella namucuonensis]|uniref:Transcriptional regulator GlxA family, contains an amidase domain and an AraC-type DNA-binding HTH domain n=1 Tax=Pseudoduganella namucuonensis TaxID=1035707 RepID=A0A1I7L9H5_9BURK|nr:helix-turn-helix domain-containing protein [Pseudoduganella namucuonensis]SFV06422.1 Transcriptional regulator GlxA family, contains an amidase domain and an AraC-type DNA-binding HTH domain [Pseudoduganella namucuonensis]
MSTPFAHLSILAREQPLRVLLVNAGEADTLTWAGLAQPLRLAARLLGGRLQLDVRTPRQAADGAADGLADHAGAWHLALLVADETQAALPPPLIRAVIERCRAAPYWGGVGAGVLWLAEAGLMGGVRIALPWALYADAEDIAERAILTPNLFELDGPHLSCCGGAASADFALTLVEALFGPNVQAEIKEALCIDRVRGPEERQRVALQARFGALQPKLSEAVTLMEANIEEPLSTDDVAGLVGLSRRQLERLFKQYLGSLPSRYYLELRLQRARQLLLETNYSIVQVGLMCGFSSGSHFSTAFGTLFGNTPREERQRKLAG